MHHRRLLSFSTSFAFLLLCLAILAAAPSVGAASTAELPLAERAAQELQAEAPVIYNRYDASIELRQDGSFHVREIQQIRFNDSFRTAFAEIPLDYVTDIQNVQISSEGTLYEQVSFASQEPGTYFVRQQANSISVQWTYEQTEPGDVLEFVLEYDVNGGLWVYEDGDILEWRVVPSDRSGVPVLESTVTVQFPEPVASNEVQANAFGVGYESKVTEQQVTFVATEEIPDGTAFQIMVGFPHALVNAKVQPWQRAEDSDELAYRIPAVVTELQIAPDGTVGVTERQTVTVEAGTLYGGERHIRLAYLERITDLAVFEGDQPMTMLTSPDQTCEYCAWTRETKRVPDWASLDANGSVILEESMAGQITVEWLVPPLVKGEEATFVLQYTALGAVQVREEEQVLVWTPVSGFAVPVQNAEIIVELPPGVGRDDVQVEGGGVRWDDQGRFALQHDGPIGAGESWQIRVALPPEATTAEKPAWQRDLEATVARAETIREQVRQQEIRRARLQLIFGIAGALLLVGGLLLVGLLWYMWGRDRPLDVVPDYLSEPPSDLPPGIVAYLVDEKPTPKGVLASLFHLATLGLLRIELSQTITLSRNWDENLVEGQEIETPSGDTDVIPPHMVRLFNGLKPHIGREPISISEIGKHLPRLIPAVYQEMGLEAKHFFDQLPTQAHRRWLVIGQWIVLTGAGFATAAALIYLRSLGWIALAPALAFIVAGAALILVSRWMPRRSDAGLQEAARWRAFENYLRQLQTYGDEAAAQQILDRHFAYAVALDVEDVVLEQAAQMGNRMPTWTRPIVIYQSAPQSMPQGNSSRPLVSRPAKIEESTDSPLITTERAPSELSPLEGLSHTLVQRLEQANASLTSVLNTAVGDSEETPFQLVVRGARGAAKLTWDTTTTSVEIMNDILDEASSGGGSTTYRGSSSNWRPSSRSSFGSSRSSGSSARSSGARRSGGGGSRGFGK